MPTLCTLNLNGIRSAERRGFSKWLAQSEPDVLCLQELRATTEDVEDALHTPPGYRTRWCSAAKKGYSGVALFARLRQLGASSARAPDVADLAASQASCELPVVIGGRLGRGTS